MAKVPEKGGTVYCSECGCSTHCADKISIAKSDKGNDIKESSNKENGSKSVWKNTGSGLLFFVKVEVSNGER